ncbi:MAG TPA: M14 family zinc carboxypeptidase [Xanthomonadales bacterium]|nr:M14 family zinc carboxypeptidase [Xanthomonadales bacterium]
MLKHLFAVSAATAMLVVTPSIAADPLTEAANAGQGRLDLYTIETTNDVAEAMRAAGHDITHSEATEGGSLIIEVVMSPGEARKASRAYDLDMSLKRNRSGQTTAEAASAEAANGLNVWRSWSEAGGLRDEMLSLADQYDDLTQLITIGQSVDGQDIYAMRVTEKADTKREGSRPAVLYISAQHAREWIAPEVNRRLMRYYLENYGIDDRVTGIVDSTELWFVIVANPDGYDWTFTDGNRLWRKNLADNDGNHEITPIDGVDLNRNFSTNWGYDNEGSSDNPTSQTYRGPAPQSEPETQAMDSLMGRIDFSFMVNYHSTGELILYGTGWQVDTPTPDDLVNIALAGDDFMPAIDGYDPDLSAELYITNGETTDHAGGVHQIMAYTPELASCFTASQYFSDDEFGPTYCQDEGRSSFEFPDSEALVQYEFELNIDYALAMAESAADPAHPVSPVGTPAPGFQVNTFPESWGAEQEVAVWARRSAKQLRMHYRINGGAMVVTAATEWTGGETYGDEGNIWYAEYRATVEGATTGDSVEVWFTAIDVPSGGGPMSAQRIESAHFTYDVITTSGADVLIVSDTSPGTALGGNADPDFYTSYYTDALDANGVSYDIFHIGNTDVPHHMGVLSHYDLVIWFTGDKLVTDYQGGLNTTLLAHEVNMTMRDYLNEGGKILATGKNHGFEEFFPLDYGENSDPAIPCSSGDCLTLSNDVYQYWFGAYTRNRRGGLADDGNALDITGLSGAFEGYSFGLDGGDSANNQGSSNGTNTTGTGTASFLLTSSVLPEMEYPQFASDRLAAWGAPAGLPYEPVSGDWQMSSGHDDVSYKRLATTIDLSSATSASLEFLTSYAIETDWDYMIVEVHTMGMDDWTTLPDLNGNTAQGTGLSCPSGWVDELHPFLARYMDDACNPFGTTGDWHAATGASSGIESWSIDLSAWAGSEIEVAISYVTDISTGDFGVFLDDVEMTIDGSGAIETSFEDGLGPFTVPGAPAGSAPNLNDWQRVGTLFEVSSIIATEDTLLFGFGFEGIQTAAERNEVMARALEHLLGD